MEVKRGASLLFFFQYCFPPALALSGVVLILEQVLFIVIQYKHFRRLNLNLVFGKNSTFGWGGKNLYLVGMCQMYIVFHHQCMDSNVM